MSNTLKSTKRLLHQAVPISLLLLVSANLYAQQSMSISLKGSAEVPPVMTSAMATGKITVSPDHTVSGSIKTSGIASTVAHIHEAAVGQNGPPIITLSKTAYDTFVVPADARLTDAEYRSYMSGNLYVNVHSAKYPNGEIRTQLLGKPMHLAN